MVQLAILTFDSQLSVSLQGTKSVTHHFTKEQGSCTGYDHGDTTFDSEKMFHKRILNTLISMTEQVLQKRKSYISINKKKFKREKKLVKLHSRCLKVICEGFIEKQLVIG